jgi:hypothetical protein
MAAPISSQPLNAPGKFVTSNTMKTAYSVFMLLGVIAFALGLMRDPERIWHSYLVSFFFFTSLGLGGLFFVATQHASAAGWSASIRRMPEAMTSFLPYAAVAAIGLVFGSHHLYEWLDKSIVAQDYLLQGKSAYLNATFFVVRLVVFFGAWLFFQKKMIGNSVAQDKDGADKWTLKNATLGIVFLLVFALSYSLFSVDTMMSLQPHWYSTMFGVYCFAGLFQSSIAFIILMILYVMKKGLVKGFINENHLHDMGKFMLAFTVFYAYIAFSQFMLIWYANLPEETIVFLNRSNGPWMGLSLCFPLFKFAIPFLLMLPKWAKRTPGHLALVAFLILVMQFLEMYWIVYPNLDNNEILFSWQEIGVALGFLGVFLMAITRFLSKNAVVAFRDARIGEAIHHEVTY